jgi:hypothetical protein
MTAEEHLRAMIGDLMMQIAMLRAQLDEARKEPPRPNGADREEHPNAGISTHN